MEAFWKFYRAERKRMKHNIASFEGGEYRSILDERRYRVSWILAIPFWILSLADISLSGSCIDSRLCAVIYFSYCIFALMAFLTYEGHINKPTKQQFIERRIYVSVMKKRGREDCI